MVFNWVKSPGNWKARAPVSLFQNLFQLSFIIIFLFQSCTYLAMNPPRPKKTDPFSDPLVVLGLLAILNNAECRGNGKFWVRNISLQTGASYCVDSTFVGTSAGADFYVENSLGTSVLSFPEILSEYSTKIAPKLETAFGPVSDVDGDKKIVILTLDIRDGATASTGFIAGFVDPINFTKDSNRSLIRSNEKEILYMDGNELIKKRSTALGRGEPDPFLATLAHELQHLIRYQHSTGSDPTWIDEGTSEVASDLSGYGPQIDRIKCFKGTSDSACTDGIQGTSPFNWSGTLRNYSYSYAFIRYLYLVSGSTEAERNTFFLDTVRGKNGSRANSATGLMEVFKTTPTFTSYTGTGPNLNSANTTNLFKFFLSYFLGRSQNYTNFSASNVVIDGTATNLSDLNTHFTLNYSGSYTLPSGTTDLSFNSNGGVSLFSPGVVARRFLPTTGTNTISSGSTYIAFNPSPTGSSISQSILAVEEEPIVLHDGANCITPQLFLNEVRTRTHANRRFLFNPQP